MFRTVFVWFCIVLFGLIFGIFAILSYPFDPRGRLGHHCARIWGKLCLIANGVRLKIEGLEHLQKEGPYIFMVNHQGSYDIFSILGYLPFQFKWLAKKELFSIPVLGWGMTAVGYISIDRAGTRETVEAMNRAARKIREGMSVVIFPEGSRSPDGFIQPFKKGGFTLAIKSKVPIVPMAIAGSREIISKGTMRVSPGDIRVRIGQPIETEDCSMKDRTSLMERVSEAITGQFRMIADTPKEQKAEGSKQ